MQTYYQDFFEEVEVEEEHKSVTLKAIVEQARCLLYGKQLILAMLKMSESSF